MLVPLNAFYIHPSFCLLQVTMLFLQSYKTWKNHILYFIHIGYSLCP